VQIGDRLVYVLYVIRAIKLSERQPTSIIAHGN